MLLGVGIFMRLSSGQNNDTKQETKPETASSDSFVDLSPATPEEHQESDDKKQDIVKADQQTAQPGQKTAVTPVLVDVGVYDGFVEIRAYISGVVEDRGTCTATLKQGSRTVVKTTTGAADATTSRCVPFRFPASDLGASGTWSVTLSYGSDSAQGTSTAQNLEVK